MVANTVPIYPGVVNVVGSKITGLNTGRDGSGSNLVTAFTAGANGSRIENIRFKHLVTNTAGMWRAWAHDAGTNFYLLGEIATVATTVAANTPSFEGMLDFSAPANALFLPSGWTIRVGSEKAEATDVIVTAGDY